LDFPRIGTLRATQFRERNILHEFHDARLFYPDFRTNE
jgi:hypothetical protein